MDHTLLFRRMSAEGLPSINTLAETIVSVGESMKKHGIWISESDRKYSHVELIQHCLDSCDPNKYYDPEEGSSFYVLKRSLDSLVENLDKETILGFLERLPNGTELYNTRHNGNYDMYRKNKGEWLYIESYGELYHRLEEKSYPFLPTGIRAAVAAALGVTGDLSGTFHAAFDAAVTQIEMVGSLV